MGVRIGGSSESLQGVLWVRLKGNLANTLGKYIWEMQMFGLILTESLEVR